MSSLSTEAVEILQDALNEVRIYAKKFYYVKKLNSLQAS